LKELLVNDREIREFHNEARDNSESMKNIAFFREAMMPMEEDDEKRARFKEAFRKMCEIFVSKYATKWIYTSS